MQRILTLFYFEQRDLTEVAKALDLSLSWVSRMHRVALARLAELLAADPDRPLP